MRRQDTSRFAVLGLLTVEPMSGYDLRKHFQESLSYFWSESYGRIYPTLKTLEGDGLVKLQPSARTARRERRVYCLTPKGRAALREWLGRSPQRQPPRNEFLLKLFLGDSAPDGAILRHLKYFRSKQEELLAMYMIIQDSVLQEHAASPNLRYWMLGLDHGLRICRAEIDWSNHAMRELEMSQSRRSTKMKPPQQ